MRKNLNVNPGRRKVKLGCANFGFQVTRATRFVTVAPNGCASLPWNLPWPFVLETQVCWATSLSIMTIASWTTRQVQSFFSLFHKIQTGFGAFQASYTAGTGGCFPMVQRPGHEAGHSHLVPRVRMKTYVYSAIRLHSLVLKQAQGQLSLLIIWHSHILVGLYVADFGGTVIMWTVRKFGLDTCRVL
jgi:hypothetical protein